MRTKRCVGCLVMNGINPYSLFAVLLRSLAGERSAPWRRSQLITGRRNSVCAEWVRFPLSPLSAFQTPLGSLYKHISRPRASVSAFEKVFFVRRQFDGKNLVSTFVVRFWWTPCARTFPASL